MVFYLGCRIGLTCLYHVWRWGGYLDRTSVYLEVYLYDNIDDLGVEMDYGGLRLDRYA